MAREQSRLVFTTDQAIPRKEKPAAEASGTIPLPAQQKVTVRLDRKGRGGKSVTLVEGLRMLQRDGEAFLKELKARLGTGGTVRDGAFEIQGDHRDLIMAVLEKRGYRPKRSGG